MRISGSAGEAGREAKRRRKTETDSVEKTLETGWEQKMKEGGEPKVARRLQNLIPSNISSFSM
jgi:hypothetical protein